MNKKESSLVVFMVHNAPTFNVEFLFMGALCPTKPRLPLPIISLCGLSEDIQCHVWPYFFSKLANHQIRGDLALHWFGLCCFMTPGLNKDIQCHVQSRAYGIQID